MLLGVFCGKDYLSCKYNSNTDRGYEGVAIIMKSSLQTSQIPLNSFIKGISFTVSIPFHIQICNLNLSPHVIVTDEDNRNLFAQFSLPMLLMGRY